MNGNLGHWKLECEWLENARSFTYKMVGDNGMSYIGAKDMNNGPWEYYQGSSDEVHDAIQAGVRFEHCILKMFDTQIGAFEFEYKLIQDLQCDQSPLYYNKQSKPPHFTFCGKHHTTENKELFRELNTGKTHSEETLNKMRKKRKNVHRMQKTEDTKDKMREAKIGTKIAKDVKEKIKQSTHARPSKNYRVQIDDEVYESLYKAAAAKGCTPQAISYRIKSGNFPNYKFAD